ncbi:MAG: rhomboid family intramembrane serine protease [Candidatus Thermoplasmatota archaeon]|jgi:membrane associated rhomboid family serine protease|nr:rhomboid family intramembrane serine protease [Candidatus Thermoplasmatota archaeon]
MGMIFLSLQPISIFSILAICIMISALVIAYFKKWMITYAILIANLVVFIITLVFQEKIYGHLVSTIIIDLGFRPIYLSLDYLPKIYTLFTSMFVHSGFFHIFGNMIIFFFMGMAFEQRIGAKKFLAIYLVTGVCGALTHSLLNLGSDILLVGASGAIFGILGAFAYSYPRDEVVMPIPIGIMFIMRIKVLYAAIIFAVFETIIVWLDVQDTTAHYAHLGGLISGVILAALLIRTKRPEGDTSSATISYDSYATQKPGKINFSSLRELATTPELKDMLNRIEHETVPQVRDIWFEHFIEKTRCPRCGKTLNHFDKDIWCESCGFKIRY